MTMIEPIEKFGSSAFRFEERQVSITLLRDNERASKVFFVRIHKLSNVRVDAAAVNHVTDKLSMASSVIPLASNDLLSHAQA